MGFTFGLKKADMAAIDYATCGISDVIAHSLKLHSPLLSDHLRAHARVHAQFADAYDNREVMRNELDLADNGGKTKASTDDLEKAPCNGHPRRREESRAGSSA